VVRMGLWISVLFWVSVMPVLWGFEWLALKIGQQPEVAALGQDYMRIAQWGMLPAMLIMVLKSYMSALERPSLVLWGTILAGVANAFINYALIFGHWGAPELGVRGAAIASVLTQSLTFVILAVLAQVLPAFRPYAIFSRIWRTDWPAFFEVFHLGWPIGATMLAEVGLFSASAVMMGWIGTRELASHGIAIQIASMAFMIYLGLANAATIRTGHALGSGDHDGIWRAGMVVIALQLAIAAVMVALFLLIPEFLVGLFLDSSNPDSAAIVSYGAGLLIFAAIFQVVDGLQVAGLSILRGLKDTRVPMFWAVISYWIVAMPSGYLLGFPLGFGGYGIWSGLVIGLTLAAVTMLARFFALMRRLRGS
ncbi:MAG: MATE family efflux transporter, partial [Paracoccaceae bacterium]